MNPAARNLDVIFEAKFIFDQVPKMVQSCFLELFLKFCNVEEVIHAFIFSCLEDLRSYGMTPKSTP